ncbi:sigma-54-dependent transcriptional regulator [Limisalsivibrio acetivorans]|uniref:sigma-54-dependent transcriptional regulator n=1 Tax=Limisalsivibrio acetivorans TaxID=1304888 RepID=UPI0003B30BB9|nr:sigma-54 dependent transcriptional regulator [Limisalsivibrio acetivorans]
MKPTIIIVDDEKSILEACELVLRSAGYENVIPVQDGRNLHDTLSDNPYSIVLLDLNMPHITGKDLLNSIVKEYPNIPVIIITANSDIDSAVDCLRVGAYDYLVKPLDIKRLQSSIKNAGELLNLRYEVSSLKYQAFREEIKRPEAFSHVLTANPKMSSIFSYIEAISNSGQPVLVLGETGSGKEMIARAIHNSSGLEGDFIPVDLSGLDDTMFSDTLFGHTKGAYTGADRERQGLVERAAGGTLFLDEIGDLNEQCQLKLLRLIQEEKYLPLGSDKPKRSKARIVAAANKELHNIVGSESGLRKDLYFRLSTHLIIVPPLRERPEDIRLLTEYFAEQSAEAMDKPKPGIDEEIINILSSYSFPGNVRELKALVVDAVAFSTGGKFPAEILRSRMNTHHTVTKSKDTNPNDIRTFFGKFPTLSEMTEHIIDEAMKVSNNNQKEAARLLGISRQALNKRLLNRKELSEQQ